MAAHSRQDRPKLLEIESDLSALSESDFGRDIYLQANSGQLTAIMPRIVQNWT